MLAKRLRFLCGSAVLFAAATFGGCIVSDQLTTITIHPDGSADLVRFQSNVRSNEEGAKGEEELRRFAEEFDARRDPDLLRITESGAKVVEARWVSREAAFSTLVVARIPTAASLESFCTFKDERGETVVAGRFVQDGRRRRLSLLVSPSADRESAGPDTASIDCRRALANGFSETRLAVTKGKIVDARGFTVAADKQSALLSPDEIDRLVRASREEVEIYLEWELVGD